MFDGLRKLLGLVGAAPAQKPLVNYGGSAGRAVAEAGKNMQQPLQPMQHILKAKMQVPQFQQQTPLWQQGNFGPQMPQVEEDSGNVWSPQGIQPLNQLQQGQPWVNASGPFKRPRY